MTTCQVGRSERTLRCDEICTEASRARSATEREDLQRCAEEGCGERCE